MARGTWGGALDPNVFRVKILFLLGTQKCQTGFHLRDVATNDNSAADVANEVHTQLQQTFRQLLTPRDSYDGVDVVRLGSDEGAGVTATQRTGLLNTSAANDHPTFVAGVLSLRSEIRKRYGQGRMFLPLTSDAYTDGDSINTDGLAGVQPFITALTDHFTGDPVTHDLLLVNAHGVLPAIPPVGTKPGRPEIPASWYDVNTLRLNSLVTSLRSRKVGVGS